jgi:hypothetical protein
MDAWDWLVDIILRGEANGPVGIDLSDDTIGVP